MAARDAASDPPARPVEDRRGAETIDELAVTRASSFPPDIAAVAMTDPPDADAGRRTDPADPVAQIEGAETSDAREGPASGNTSPSPRSDAQTEAVSKAREGRKGGDTSPSSGSDARSIATKARVPSIIARSAEVAPPKFQPAPIAPDPKVGQRIGGYLLLEHLGQGGAASVFRSRRESDGEIIALKILASAKVSRARVVQRFLDEAHTAQSVSHRALVRFIELLDQRSPRRLAYAMEYVAGEPLRHRLERDESLPLLEAIHVAREICEGVQALHDAGVIHRDLKPENIMLQPGAPGACGVKILDFGVAKFLKGRRTAGSETPGTFVGTPRYMAPEQAAGGTVDARSDLFAIGVMLFEMITGRRPHEGDSLKAVVMAKLKGAPRINVNPEHEVLPQELADVVDSCLKLQLDLRPRDALTLIAALDEARAVLSAVGAVRLDPVTGALSSPIRSDSELAPLSPGEIERISARTGGPAASYAMATLVSRGRSSLSRIASASGRPSAPGEPAEAPRSLEPTRSEPNGRASAMQQTSVPRRPAGEPQAPGSSASKTPPTAPRPPAGSASHGPARDRRTLAAAAIAATTVVVGLGLVALTSRTEEVNVVPTESRAEVEEAFPVQLESAPPGAEVRVEGKTVGTTPLEVRLNPGRSSQRVELSLPGYKARTFNLTRAAGPMAKVDLERVR